jgi:hypothetical protein
MVDPPSQSILFLILVVIVPQGLKPNGPFPTALAARIEEQTMTVARLVPPDSPPHTLYLDDV